LWWLFAVIVIARRSSMFSADFVAQNQDEDMFDEADSENIRPLK
jgi:hypothetical protein